MLIINIRQSWRSIVYGIKWVHDIQGIQDLTTIFFVVNLMEAAKRQPHRPKVKKKITLA